MGAGDGIGYYARTWTTDDGVPHNSVMRAVQDSAGFLWFGTSAGLARFDGQKFVRVDLGAGSMRSAAVRGLAEESPEVLIVLTSGSDLVRLKNGKASAHPRAQDIAELGQDIFDLYVEPAGAIWLATGAGLLIRCAPGGEMETFGMDEPVAARTKRFTFATDENGVTWIASDDYLAAYRQGRLERHPDTPAGPLLIASAWRAGVWICSKDALLRLNGGNISQVSDAVPWKGDISSLRHFTELRQGDLVFTGHSSIIRYREGRFLAFPTSFAIANCILEDREGNLWVGTSGGGVAQIRERAHRIFNESSGLRSDNVSALAEDAQHTIWVANRSGGLYRLDVDAGRVERRATAPDNFAVETVAVDRAGKVWFGGRDIGLWYLSDGMKEPRQMTTVSAGVNALLATRSGHVWFATTNGEVGRILDDRIDPINGENFHGLATIYAMAEDDRGGLWFGGRRGLLARWDGKTFTHCDPNLIPSTVHSLLIDSSGLLWVGSAGGLALYENEKLHWLTREQGLPDEIIYNIAEDDHGRLWLATRRGLFHVSRTELVSVARGELRRVTSSRYGPEQGLRGFTPTPNFFPGALKSRNGHLWFSTTQGVVEIDVSKIARSATPSPVHLDVVRWDGEVAALGSKTIEFPSGRHRVDFELVVFNYTDPDNVAMEHRLEGFDRDWVETGVDHTATYTNLPPGMYHFHARVRSAAGGWAETKGLVSLIIVPAWWERMSTQIIAAIALVVLVATVARVVAQRRLRIRVKLLEQQQALEKERGRIARDLHDELGAGLTEVGMLADRLIPRAPQQLAPELAGLAWRTRRLATDLSGIVWTMNAGQATLDHFAVFLRRYAERFFRNTGTRCVTTGVEQIPALPLPPDVQHHLLATAKEALSNVLKHAHASEVYINISYGENVLDVRIRDNGAGSPVRSVDEGDGNGLKNMNSRIREIGGVLEFNTTPGEGTMVSFRVPLGEMQE